MSVLNGLKKAYKKTIQGEKKPYAFAVDTIASRIKADKKIKKATPYSFDDAALTVLQIERTLRSLNLLIENKNKPLIYRLKESVDNKNKEQKDWTLFCGSEGTPSSKKIIQFTFKKSSENSGILLAGKSRADIHCNIPGSQILLSKNFTPFFNAIFQDLKEKYAHEPTAFAEIKSRIKTDLGLD